MTDMDPRYKTARWKKLRLVDGSLIPFEAGEHKTADPIVIARLRKVATTRPMWGIVEVQT